MLNVKIVNNGLSFIFLLIFFILLYFTFSLFSIFRTARIRVDWSRCHISYNLMAQSQDQLRDLREGSRRFQNKVMSYSMNNTCWPHVILIIIQSKVHSSQHGPWVLVYKINYSILGTLLSSLVSLLYKSYFLT